MGAPSINLPPFAEFAFQPRETAPTRFDKYIKRLENMFLAMSVTDAKQKKAMLMHYIGDQGNDVFDTLTVPTVSTDHADRAGVFACAIKALKEHLEPQKCIDHHVYVFQKEVQRPDETITEFYTRLQLLAKKCEFADPNLEIKRQIIQGTTSVRLRRKAIEQGHNLKNLLKAARAMEAADEHTQEMEKQQVNAVNRKYPTKPQNKPEPWKQKAPRGYPSHHGQKQVCGLCGGQYPHRKGPESCPAYGKTCHQCGKANHFAKCCRMGASPKKYYKPAHHHAPKATKKVRQINQAEPSPEEDMYVYPVSTPYRVNSVRPDMPMTKMKICSSEIDVMIDTGASINVIYELTYRQLKTRPKLNESQAKIQLYGVSNNLDVKGKFRATVQVGIKRAVATFFVVSGSPGSLIGH